ncbi:tannase/feruloyl esterase family alpha/beta hydrolase [Vibrio sp. FJH11]
MKKSLITTAILFTAFSGATHAADCSELANVKLVNVDITSAKTQAAQTLPPDPMSAMTGASPTAVEVGEHCLVEGKIEDREGVNGRYGIRFQLRMPVGWNGRFLFQGGGGTDGFIAPAVGTIPSTGSTAKPALERGYAVVSMDGGHDGFNMDFTADQQARLDLAYASIGKVTHTAKALIHSYYQKSPNESFFMGCSNGGREAMMAASRFPLEFDGVVVGNPGFHLTRAAIGAVWDVEHLRAIAPEGKLYQALTQDDLDIVSNGILEKCDALDGVKDGIVANYPQCQFQTDSLKGKLSEPKLAAITAIMKGAHDSAGNPVYTGWPWDPGINSAGWRAWKLGTADHPGLHESMSIPSAGAMFMTPPQATPSAPDYGKFAADVADVGGYFNADETFLTTFAQRGGKMVIFQGLADPIFSATDIARWYEQTSKDTGTDVAQLFMVPGMTHCGGGPAFEDFDPLTALEQWKETGEKPKAMIAKAPTMPEREMPLCAYPNYAKFTGGDKNNASNYQCVAP